MCRTGGGSASLFYYGAFGCGRLMKFLKTVADAFRIFLCEKSGVRMTGNVKSMKDSPRDVGPAGVSEGYCRMKPSFRAVRMVGIRRIFR